jgi:predicted acylesterase/phospholipase RssA
MPNVSKSLSDRLAATGKKRILSLDGGGIRGAVTLGYLGKLEEILAKRHEELGLMPRDKFRLYHYFDLIGGTSTGSIIAALLAIGGYSVPEIKELYRKLGRKIFSDRNGFNLLGHRIYLNRKYDATPLKEELKNIFGDAILGDDTNKTGFCAVTKRLDTCSTWPVTNNPNAIYFEKNRYFIRDIVRASTAAPSYFEPEMMDIGSGVQGVFVDGGMSIMNNPSLQLFLVATLKGFKLNWETGEDNLFIVSLGTGRKAKQLIGKKWRDPHLWDIAQFAPDQFMSDAGETVEIMMHLLGKGTGVLRQIDREVEDLAKDSINNYKAFSYLRYNLEIIKDELIKIGITDLSDSTIDDLMEMDLAGNVDLLIRIGEAAANKYVLDAHLPTVFDLIQKKDEQLESKSGMFYPELVEDDEPVFESRGYGSRGVGSTAGTTSSSGSGGGYYREEKVQQQQQQQQQASDPVCLGAAAPASVKPGQKFTARFMAYVKELENEIKEKIQKLSPTSQVHTDLKQCLWQVNTKVKVRLHADHLTVDPVEQEFSWNGDSEIVEFDVTVEKDAPEETTTLAFDVSIADLRVAWLRVDVAITNKTVDESIKTTEGHPITKAFASYASQDQAMVMHRLSEISRNGVDVFVDCLSLHPGDSWKDKLKDEILHRQAFYLFWSHNAKESKWVEWEWRTALMSKGIKGIDPHPLEDPKTAPPPDELKDLHFGDLYMWIKKARE